MCGENEQRSRTALDDLLDDPLIRLIMQADKVTASQVRQLCGAIPLRRAGTVASSSPGTLTAQAVASSDFRRGVGIMLLNSQGEVFVGRRTRHPETAWQMPQGGIKQGEAPLSAALRELREEIGTDHVEVLAESDCWLRYELPPDLVGRAWQGRWRGQQQKWFAMRFLGNDGDIDVGAEEPEFSAWRWVPIAQLPMLIVEFKRQVYLEVTRQFEGLSAVGTSTSVPPKE